MHLFDTRRRIDTTNHQPPCELYSLFFVRITAARVTVTKDVLEKRPSCQIIELLET